MENLHAFKKKKESWSERNSGIIRLIENVFDLSTNATSSMTNQKVISSNSWKVQQYINCYIDAKLHTLHTLSHKTHSSPVIMTHHIIRHIDTQNRTRVSAHTEQDRYSLTFNC